MSFGIDAARYDSWRPGYPSVVADLLTADSPTAVLDIGCGTGLASRPFIERGCAVVGVEPDERMAAVAREHGVDVEVARFEDWDPGGRGFDLVICAQAWWWLERPAAIDKILEVLAPGGRLAVLWNSGAREDTLTLALSEAYRAVADQVREPMLPGGFSPGVVDELEADDRFHEVEASRFEWSRRYRRNEWVEAAATFGDVITLPDAQRNRLLASIGETIDAHGGVRDVRIATTLVTALQR